MDLSPFELNGTPNMDIIIFLNYCPDHLGDCGSWIIVQKSSICQEWGGILIACDGKYNG